MMAALFAAVPAWAGEAVKPAGVVELFTSQGCSSCPAADEVLLDLARAGNVIALGYHVDYWDYRGWKDTLGSPDFSERQNQYARSLSSRGVYTPQAVVNGQTHVNGSDRPAIDRALADTSENNSGLPIDLTIRRQGESVIITAGEGDRVAEQAHLILVFFDKETEVAIERGENRGRTITYANVVTGIQTAGIWHGAPTRIELPAAALARQGTGGCAVLLQRVDEDGAPGEILGAAVMHSS